MAWLDKKSQSTGMIPQPPGARSSWDAVGPIILGNTVSFMGLPAEDSPEPEERRGILSSRGDEAATTSESDLYSDEEENEDGDESRTAPPLTRSTSFSSSTSRRSQRQVHFTDMVSSGEADSGPVLGVEDTELRAAPSVTAEAVTSGVNEDEEEDNQDHWPRFSRPGTPPPGVAFREITPYSIFRAFQNIIGANTNLDGDADQS